MSAIDYIGIWEGQKCDHHFWQDEKGLVPALPEVVGAKRPTNCNACDRRDAQFPVISRHAGVVIFSPFSQRPVAQLVQWIEANLDKHRTGLGASCNLVWQLKNLWICCSVRAPALPHDPAWRHCLPRELGWRRQSISGCSRSWRLPCHSGGARLHAQKLWSRVWIAVSVFVVPLFLTAFGLVVHNLPKSLQHALGFYNYRDVKQM